MDYVGGPNVIAREARGSKSEKGAVIREPEVGVILILPCRQATLTSCNKDKENHLQRSI